MSWNQGAERIFGYKEAEIIGKSISVLIPPYLQHEENTIINEIKAGRTVEHYQTIRLTKSGKEVPISLTISPMRNKAGQRSEEHTSELKSLMRISYAVF